MISFFSFNYKFGTNIFNILQCVSVISLECHAKGYCFDQYVMSHIFKLEDEYHFLIECDKHKIQQEDLLTNISINCKQFQHLGKQDRSIYILSAGIETVEHVAELIYKNLP